MIKLSVVIPTYNKPEIIKMTLESLGKQTLSKNQFEVMVIDDGSSVKVQRQIKSFLPSLNLNISFLTQTHKGPAAARNKGIKRAKGKIVLIINDDTIITPSLFKRHYDFHRKNPEENFGLLGYVTWHPGLEITPFMYWLEHGGPYFSFHQIKGKEAGWQRFWTCNISLKRSFLLKNGLFDEEFPYAAWEDVELGYRLGKAGLRLFYDKKALGYHYHPTTLKSIKDKMERSGESALILKDKISYKFLPPIVRHPLITICLDKLLLPRPIFLFLEKIALMAEKKVNLAPLFDIILLHYRIKGMTRGLKIKEVMKNYDKFLSEEKREWERIEKEMSRKGVPCWVDLRQANMVGKDSFWREDPRKEKIVRGEEKKRLIEMAIGRKGRVLDLGCGSGWLSLELAREGLEVIGVDASPERIKIANEFLRKNPYKKNFGKLTYMQADINKIEFPEGYYDTIVVWDTLHHFPNLDQILVKYSSYLKPQGLLVVFDHIGNRYLKLAQKVHRFFSESKRKEKIIPYEDILGKEMLNIISKYFQIDFLETKLCFPVSAALYMFLSKDIFFPVLPLVIKLDRILCRSRIFTGEYFFLKGIKREK